ncbi:MAG: hypothetical protein ACI9G1_001794 [Pirellulaceae bacterium]|jgi:hypothetical protein
MAVAATTAMRMIAMRMVAMRMIGERVLMRTTEEAV